MDTDSLFFELYRNIPRQGPGDDESTRKAFSFLKDIPSNIKLLDVGCGSGIQSIQLAKLINGHITAIDIHQPFLSKLKASAENKGLSEKITILNKSMYEMDFPGGSFHVIWSEGSMYIYGFRNALNDWKRMINTGGYLVCSHITWLRDDPPDEVRSFWEEEYPEIAGVVENIDTIQRAGYSLIEHFVLPEESWWNNYYIPLKNRLAAVHQKYRTNSMMQKLVKATEDEIRMFERFSDYYGYIFYIMKLAERE